MYHHHSQQEEPPQPFSNRPRPFNHQEQAHQQQQQHHSHFQYPPIKGSRNTDMEPMNMDIDMYLDRMNGSRSGGFSSSPQRVSESKPGHKRVVLERVVLERVALDSSDYRHPDQMSSSPPSTVTQQPQSSHSAMGMQAWMHEPPSPQTRGSHSGVGDGQGVIERAGSILASFGLSSQDLKVLSQYPEDRLTPDNLPYIIQDILSRKSNDQNIAASSSSSYSQSATRTVCETQPPPSCSHGSLGRRRSPEVSGICIDYGHSSRTTIDYGHSSLPTIEYGHSSLPTIEYGHSSLPTIVSSSREAFIREPLSCESLSDTERKKEKIPPASSLPKQEMDVTPEMWQFCPQPPVPNKHGDLDYCRSSSEFHKSKRSPTPERLLPPRSRHPDPDYRRDSPKRSPSSETQRDYSSSSRRHKSKRSPTPERLLPPRSRHPDPDYRRDSPKRSPSSETRRDYSSSSRHPDPWIIKDDDTRKKISLSKPRDDTKRLSTGFFCKLCKCYLPKGPDVVNAHVTGRRHAKSLQLLDPKRKPNAPSRREQHSLSQDNVPTTRWRPATPDDDSATHIPPPTSTVLSEESPDDGNDSAEEDSILKDPDYPEIFCTNGIVIGYHCKLCNIRVETMNAAEISHHVNGKKHSVKSLRSLVNLVKNRDNLEDICRDQSIVAVYKNQSSPYHCKLCDIRMESAAQMYEHSDGKKHNVLLIQIKSLRSLYLAKNTANLEDICWAESIVVVDTNPLTVSHCELCNFVFPERYTKQGVHEHLIGRQHVTSLWNKMKKSIWKDGTARKAPRLSAHLQERHLQELYLEIEANLGKKYNRNAERDAMIYTSRDEHVEEVSSNGKAVLKCKLCQCFLPTGAPINDHLMGKKHAVSLRQLEESSAESEELHTRGFQLKRYFDAMKLKEGNADQKSSQDGAAVKRLMSEDKRREEEPMQKKQRFKVA